MRLAALELPGDVEPWVDIGFAPDDAGRIHVANGTLLVGAAAAGLVVDPGDGADVASEIEGIPVRTGSAGDVAGGIGHPNGAVELDHVVIVTDSLDRTSGVFEDALDLRCRRVRETGSVRQAFHRFDDENGTRGCIVEIVESKQAERTEIWGLVVVVEDLDVAVDAANELLGDSKPAVQPGRRIATVSQAAGLPTAVALMSR